MLQFCGILPAPVRYNKNLSPGAKVLYSEFCGESQFHSGKYLTYDGKEIAERYGVSRRTVRLWIKDLQAEGFLDAICRDKDTTQIELYKLES